MKSAINIFFPKIILIGQLCIGDKKIISDLILWLPVNFS